MKDGVAAQDRRGTWALDHPGASTLWGHGSVGHVGPNSPWGDDLMDCVNIGGYTNTAALAQEGMPCFSGAGSNAAVPRSQHHGGVNVTMADGSVRFISNYIQKGNIGGGTPNLTTQFLCWQRLCASQDGQVIDAAKF